MDIDPSNKVVQLCTDGMSNEFEGKLNESEALFNQAWALASNEFEACIAAHYMARRQLSLADKLKWNLKSFDLANKIEGDGMKNYLPSLCLNVGKSYEDLEQIAEATYYYRLGADYTDTLKENPYVNMIKSGLTEGLKRVGAAVNNNTTLNALIDKWCERKDLKPLSFILPAYVSNLGSHVSKQKLRSALSYLSAAKCLNNEEQQIVEDLIINFCQ
ncbi:hypothetical protein [Emticicia soli]|uniref:Tetratricopeptide repeat protein n=1 Tax=Emticicia soli TaxID=2027878 RepID=A0ABW5J809_9BACT